MHKFKKLAVYDKALRLTKTARSAAVVFPQVEVFGLTSQFRRAADSIVLNIAEGAGNSSKKEFSRFLDFSIRSGFECLGCCDIALVNGYMNEQLHNDLLEQINRNYRNAVWFEEVLVSLRFYPFSYTLYSYTLYSYTLYSLYSTTP